MLCGAALPAAADAPVRTIEPFSGSVSDDGDVCGFPIIWEFTGEARALRFFQDGQLVRLQALVQESGTVTNLDTGEVVELPRTAFYDRFDLGDDGSVIESVSGLSIRVTEGGDPLLDVGRFVVRFDTAELLQSSGQHPIREINPFSISDPALLGGFCDLFV